MPLDPCEEARGDQHFPEGNIAGGRPARKPASPRYVLEAVLRILNTGACGARSQACLMESEARQKVRTACWISSEHVLADLHGLKLEVRYAENQDQFIVPHTMYLVNKSAELCWSKYQLFEA